MIEQDTIKLLRECDLGVKMGVDAINDVLSHVHGSALKTMLSRCKSEHKKLEHEIRRHLKRFDDEGKSPPLLAKSMSRIKTNVRLAVNDSDPAIAELMTDGCNMGVKSLNKYLNRYTAADEFSKDIAKKLIKLEQQLSMDLQSHV